ncbi:MAG TPA: hypothetical protein VIK28_09835 [Sedimentisphaerales bacterium]
MDFMTPPSLLPSVWNEFRPMNAHFCESSNSFVEIVKWKTPFVPCCNCATKGLKEFEVTGTKITPATSRRSKPVDRIVSITVCRGQVLLWILACFVSGVGVGLIVGHLTFSK